MVNFAGAAFLGIGCYAAGVVTKYTSLPSFLRLPLGGLMAAIIGSILILPVLRTRGHYAALVTIAFGILFKVFLEVNDTLGGPQGIQVKPIVLFGWNFNSPIRIGDFTASFYFSYLLLALILLVLSFALVRRLSAPGSGSAWMPSASMRSPPPATGSISRAGRCWRSRSAISSPAPRARPMGMCWASRAQ